MENNANFPAKLRSSVREELTEATTTLLKVSETLEHLMEVSELKVDTRYAELYVAQALNAIALAQLVMRKKKKAALKGVEEVIKDGSEATPVVEDGASSEHTEYDSEVLDV